MRLLAATIMSLFLLHLPQLPLGAWSQVRSGKTPTTWSENAGAFQKSPYNLPLDWGGGNGKK